MSISEGRIFIEFWEITQIIYRQHSQYVPMVGDLIEIDSKKTVYKVNSRKWVYNDDNPYETSKKVQIGIEELYTY